MYSKIIILNDFKTSHYKLCKITIAMSILLLFFTGTYYKLLGLAAIVISMLIMLIINKNFKFNIKKGLENNMLKDYTINEFSHLDNMNQHQNTVSTIFPQNVFIFWELCRTNKRMVQNPPVYLSIRSDIHMPISSAPYEVEDNTFVLNGFNHLVKLVTGCRSKTVSGIINDEIKIPSYDRTLYFSHPDHIKQFCDEIGINPMHYQFILPMKLNYVIFEKMYVIHDKKLGKYYIDDNKNKLMDDFIDTLELFDVENC